MPAFPSAAPEGMFRALRHRNYRLFFAGQGISLVGTWITRVAMSWLVYRLTGSAVLLGVVGFAGQIPTFLLSPVAGVWVDRLDRYHVLIATQVLAMAQSAALAVLTISGRIEVWHLIVLAVVQGLISAFDVPARQAFVVEMVEGKDDLPNAIALNSSLVNGARLVGPSIAGLMVAGVGEGWCFAVDSVSYIAVIGSLLAMTVVRMERVVPERNIRADLAAGFRYAFGFRPIRAGLVLLAVVSLAGAPYTTLMPVVADRVLHGGPNTLGLLMGATGVGALGGALWLAARKSIVGLGTVIPIAAAAFGLSLAAFAFSTVLWLSMLCLVGAGAGFMIQMASTNTVIQTLVLDEMRGRVMAFYTMAFFGTLPFGSLLAGTLADTIGTPWTIAGGGAICIVGALVFSRVLPTLREQVRPIYVEKGLLPEIAVGVSVATTLRNQSAR